MTERYSNIEDNVKRVRHRIQQAATKAGRAFEDITLLGVTKTRTAGEVRQLIEAGVADIAENRVQELLDKQPQLEGVPHTAHLIGRLQRNKAKYLPGKISMLQSVDSPALVAALEHAYKQSEKPLDVLIQVNIGDEQSKSGVGVPELNHLADIVLASKCLRLRGLMAIPPFVEGEAVRQYFEQMYRLFVDIKAKKRDNDNVNILSMGMSADFEYAIAEGSTMVRVGTDLFGERHYP